MAVGRGQEGAGSSRGNGGWRGQERLRRRRRGRGKWAEGPGGCSGELRRGSVLGPQAVGGGDRRDGGESRAPEIPEVSEPHFLNVRRKIYYWCWEDGAPCGCPFRAWRTLPPAVLAARLTSLIFTVL